MEKGLATVILAAGEGKRMGGSLPKPLVKFRGRPMVDWVIDVARDIGSQRIIIVVGHRAELVRGYLEVAHEGLEFAVQREQLGTGHAVRQALPLLENHQGNVLVLCADHPAIPYDLLRDFATTTSNESASVLTLQVEDPKGYGRIIRTEEGCFANIVEERDIVDEWQREVREVNSGILLFDIDVLRCLLPLVGNSNAQKEYYLPDVLKMVSHRTVNLWPVPPEDTWKFLGVNSRDDLERLTDYFRD